jgi:hypothetical protein
MSIHDRHAMEQYNERLNNENLPIHIFKPPEMVNIYSSFFKKFLLIILIMNLVLVHNFGADGLTLNGIGLQKFRGNSNKR